jgi:hypothetical protein
MNTEECDILFISGTFDYVIGGENDYPKGKNPYAGEARFGASGNYIFYSCVKLIDNVKIKVLPTFPGTSQIVEFSDFLQPIPYDLSGIPIQNLLPYIPKHKFLFMSGDNTLSNEQIRTICNIHNSIPVNIAMTNGIFGEGGIDVSAPEVGGDLFSLNTIEKANLYKDLNGVIIVASSSSKKVMQNSAWKDVRCELIPFPLEEIEIEDIPNTQEKVILWGTTQPDRRRKGKIELEKILDELYNLCENPEEILIKHVGPQPTEEIKTKFRIEHTGIISNRLELSKIYKGAKVLAQTTLSDAGPMMSVECLRNSVPVIAFDTNITTDLVDNGKNGYIVKDEREFAMRLYDILFEDKFHMDEDHIKNFNSINIVRKKYNDFYQSLISIKND